MDSASQDESNFVYHYQDQGFVKDIGGLNNTISFVRSPNIVLLWYCIYLLGGRLIGMSGDIKKATILQSDNDFGGIPTTLDGDRVGRKKKKKRKKQSAALKPLEKAIFKQAKKYDEATTLYKERHSKSNSKKKNGWIKDFPKNYAKAMSKLMKF